MRQAIRRATGEDSMSEHSLRRSGAQMYARRGVPLAVIQHIGRWGSATIERYVGEALAARASWAPLMAAGAFDATRMVADCALPGPASPSLGTLAGAVARLVQQEMRQRPPPAHDADLREQPPAGKDCVTSVRTGTCHVIKHMDGLPVESWEAACGWKFGKVRHTLESASPISCRRCMTLATSQAG